MVNDLTQLRGNNRSRFRSSDRAGIEISLPNSCYIYKGELFINDIRRKTHGESEKKKSKRQ